jgi:hypothetical protein
MRLISVFAFLCVLTLGTGFTWGGDKDEKDETPQAEAVKTAPPLSEPVVVIDSNKDGKVTADEKKRALELWSQAEPEESAGEKALALQGDTDRDGKLEADEKKRLLQELNDSGADAARTPSKKGDKK